MHRTWEFKGKLVIGVERLPDQSEDLYLAASPLTFLQEALEGTCSGLIIAFGDVPLKERKALADLSGYVRSNPWSRSRPLLCILQETHRWLMEQLAWSGVEWTVCLERENLSLEEVLLNPDRFLRDDYSTAGILDSLCPFLHYLPLDGRRELKVCGAYRDRMVLGRPRLEFYCHRTEHRSCPFFQTPHLARQTGGPLTAERRTA
jgi:hypothetical protein